MNLPALLRGCVKILGPSDDAIDYFNLSRQGLYNAFGALIISIPLYYVCAAAILKYRAEVLDIGATYPPLAFMIILLAFGLMFPLCAYILSLVFDRQDRFRPWVIIRLWSFFFLSLLAAAIMGLNYLGLLSMPLIITPLFMLYLSTLFIDIRLAQKIADFDLGAAILIACIITAMGLMIILMGVLQYV